MSMTHPNIPNPLNSNNVQSSSQKAYCVLIIYKRVEVYSRLKSLKSEM